MKTNPNDPAFSQSGTNSTISQIGLTKREYFIAVAMSAYLSRGHNYDVAADCAMTAADHLIEQINKGTP